MSEASHHALELFWKGFNILLFLAIVYYFGRKPISQAFNEFFRKLTEGLDSSEETLKKAQEEYERAKAQYEDAQRRYQEQLKLAKETADYIREEERRKTDQMVERIKEKAKEAIEVELTRAKEELYRYAAQRVREEAFATLKETFKNPEVQKKYLERSLKLLEAER
ncbi:ATP synthase F0 subunit B [Thermocrinis minervae]|uniref:ATP synthase subunit b n=1 Tax=Thermocrinis minervae TaxID=381751 RepID=A0A1M6RRV3_9AQUI|nr:ATP synthase F0 subunit B [Thermocrinis minervae]SHK35193.1 F-type H+-transporting ATPase subunit b [Thermocrinis minervae]